MTNTPYEIGAHVQFDHPKTHKPTWGRVTANAGRALRSGNVPMLEVQPDGSKWKGDRVKVLAQQGYSGLISWKKD